MCVGKYYYEILVWGFEKEEKRIILHTLLENAFKTVDFKGCSSRD